MEPRKLPVQRRSRITVEDILSAATQVFEKYGYTAGTTNRIAVRAGVSIGTLYQYFPNKEALAVALLERHIADGMRLLERWIARCEAEALALEEALRLIVEGMLELHLAQPRLQHLLLEETPRPPRIHEAWVKAEQTAVGMITSFLKTFPEIHHPSVEVAAGMAVQTVEALTHRRTTEAHPSLPREVFTSELVRMMVAYLTTRSPG